MMISKSKKKQLHPRPPESNVGCGTQWAGPIHNNFGLGEGGARHTNPKRFLNFGHQPRSDHIRCNVKQDFYTLKYTVSTQTLN